MATDYEIREKVADYLAGDLSLDTFQEWFLPEAWQIDQDIDRSVNLARLTGTIELLLAEYTSGDRTEAELRDLLLAEASTYDANEATTRTGSGSISEVTRAAFPGFAAAGTRSEAAYA